MELPDSSPLRKWHIETLASFADLPRLLKDRKYAKSLILLATLYSFLFVIAEVVKDILKVGVEHIAKSEQQLPPSQLATSSVPRPVPQSLSLATVAPIRQEQGARANEPQSQSPHKRRNSDLNSTPRKTPSETQMTIPAQGVEWGTRPQHIKEPELSSMISNESVNAPASTQISAWVSSSLVSGSMTRLQLPITDERVSALLIIGLNATRQLVDSPSTKTLRIDSVSFRNGPTESPSCPVARIAQISFALISEAGSTTVHASRAGSYCLLGASPSPEAADQSALESALIQLRDALNAKKS